MTYIDGDHRKGAEILQELSNQVSLKTDLMLIESLKPEFSKDGNQFCYLYGTLPNDCIVGFGDTPYKAMLDFNGNFYNQKA